MIVKKLIDLVLSIYRNIACQFEKSFATNPVATKTIQKLGTWLIAEPADGSGACSRQWASRLAKWASLKDKRESGGKIHQST